MIKAIFISDFTEEFPHHLLSGIVRYSCKHEKWVICRMPPSYKTQYGIAGTIAWAKKWKADAIIGRFDDKEDVSQFEKNGIIALAQDYKSLFTSIANITGDYIRTGQMAARYFINKGFTNFAFYGYKDVVWSDQRCRGFMDEIIAAGYGDSFYTLQNQSLENLWFYESEPVIDWLKQLPHPTALLTCDDNQGNKIAEICGMAGIKVPDEISILGVDNDLSVCNLTGPVLSSIKMGIEEAGYEVARMIDELLHGKISKPHDIVIHAISVVERDSTNLTLTQNKYISKAIKFIYENITRNITTTDILEIVPMSRRLLETKFKNETGQSIHNFITKVRVEHFGQRILEEDRPIGSLIIHYDLDFNNLCRCFKRETGYSPTEYRTMFNKEMTARYQMPDIHSNDCKLIKALY